MKKWYYIYIWLGLCSLCGCEINDYVEPQALPDATHEGLQTFGTKINGSLWVPFQKYRNSPNFKPAPVIWGKLQQQTLRIAVTNQQTLESISLMVNEIHGVGTYHFMSYFPKNTLEFTPYASLYQRCANGDCSQYVVCNTCENKVNITYCDTTRKIFSGTFEVTFQKKDSPSERVTLSDGRFDIRD